MVSYPSRAEKREEKLYSSAEKGKFSAELILYPVEIKKLRKQGLSVSHIEHYKENLYSVHVDWANAFSSGMPHIVYSYLNNIIETYPRNYVKNFAQELHIISRKALI